MIEENMYNQASANNHDIDQSDDDSSKRNKQSKSGKRR